MPRSTADPLSPAGPPAPRGANTLLAVITAALLSLAAPLGAQPLRALPASVSAPSNSHLLGPVPDSQTMRLAISLPLRNPDQLRALLQQLYDPASPNYRKFLTVRQFTERFGPTQEDYEKVATFAKSRGLTVTRTFSTRLLVDVSGPASSVNATFQVTMQRYQHPTEARTFYAPDVEPTLDADLPILTVDGLNDFDLPRRPLTRRAPSVSSPEAAQTAVTGSGAGGQFLGSDIRAAYAPGVTLDGTGQTLGLVEIGPYDLSDVQMYFSTIGQTLNIPIYPVLLDVDGICAGTPETGGCNDGEEVIDMEQILSMAPNASALVVYTGYGADSSALNGFVQAATDDVAKQISLSFIWGGTPSSEPQYEQVFMELAAQGQSVFVASGDSGANPGSEGYPANSPNVTGVGGTDLTTAGAGGAWQSESGWIGSSGGWNTQSPIPSYQTPFINASNQGSTAYRNVPDVAMEANFDNYTCANGQCNGGIAGTSLATPRWAGFMALVNQQANGTSVGFLNPTAYRLAQGASYSTIFHDITTGDNFNTSSPNLFTAVTGYDLVTGLGSPNGQAMINALAPANTTAPNFTLTASPSVLNLSPGGDGTSTIRLTPVNGFSATVDLLVTTLGSPAGVTVELSKPSIKGSGSVTLTVSTTSGAPAGNIGIAITGTSEGLAHTTYVNVALPDFSIAASPTLVYLNQSGTATSTVTITPLNGFSGEVALAASSGQPAGIAASVQPASTSSTSVVTLTANSTVPTRVAYGLNITGTSGTTQHMAPSAEIYLSAAVGNSGGGMPVDLSPAYNLSGIYTDGTSFSNGGVDGTGNAFSASILTASRVLSGVVFNFGPANGPNIVAGADQTIPLPAGAFTTLQLFAVGIYGAQLAQKFTVTYTDGTTSQFTQNFSDWFSPSSFPNEAEAVAMPYHNTGNGGNAGLANLYAYAFALNSGKTVKSVTLPDDSHVLVLAATLSTQNPGTPASLSSAFNLTGIYPDGAVFSSSGGMDGVGNAYSANLLGDQAGASSLTLNGVSFNLAPPSVPDAIYGTGQEITLPAGQFSELYMLATAVDGTQTGQTVIVTYTDGTTSQFTQSFSDWTNALGYPGELDPVTLSYEDTFKGMQNSGTFYLHEYTFALNPLKTAKTLELPSNRNVVVLAVTLGFNQQTISFAALPSQIIGAAPFTVSATASSGLPVSFTLATPAACSLSGSKVTILAAGSCSITASQPGNATYSAASVTQSFTVGLVPQTITFGPLSDVTLGAGPFTVKATASSGQPVTFITTSVTVCSLSGSTVTIIGVGTCSIVAAQPGNTTYAAAPLVTQTFTVWPAFFAGEDSLGSGVYYLQFPDKNLFGYYNFVASSIFYHYDMGYESFAAGSASDIYLFDFTSGHWWYTSNTLFPYVYDFTLKTWIYYFPNTQSPGHYTTNPRYFSNLTTGMIFTM
jgi:hypothetical protein